MTDCNTLYVGGRKNTIKHLDSAYKNGYNPFATGVHSIIADGIKGLEKHGHKHGDHFTDVSPETNWISALQNGE